MSARSLTLLLRLLVAGLAVSMMAGLLGGWTRLGRPLPGLEFFRLHHGALLGGVLFPTLISLERSVAIARPWAWAAPLTGLASLAWMVLGGTAAAPCMLVLALALGLQQAWIARRLHFDQGGLMALLAVLPLALADVRWGLGHPAALCAPIWASFLVLVIASERLEFSFHRGHTPGLWALLVVLLTGLFTAHWQLVGLAWLGLALWLARRDLARINAWRGGMAAYTARCVLLGYLWLALSGAQLALIGLPFTSGPHFDRVLHGVFVGFVLTMVVAHGPMIFPAILKTPIRFSGWFYLPLALLQGSLVLRCLGLTAVGAGGNVLAMLVFGMTMACHYTPGHNPWLLSSLDIGQGRGQQSPLH